MAVANTVQYSTSVKIASISSVSRLGRMLMKMLRYTFQFSLRIPGNDCGFVHPKMSDNPEPFVENAMGAERRCHAATGCVAILPGCC